MYTSLHCPDSLLHRSTLVLLQPENIQLFVRQLFNMEAEKISFPLTFSEMSTVELHEMFTASEISVQGSVAAGFEKVTNNLNLHQTIALQGIIHVYNVHRSY